MINDIEERLTATQWLGGEQPGAVDCDTFTRIKTVPKVSTHPKAFAWYCLVSLFKVDVRDSWKDETVVHVQDDHKPKQDGVSGRRNKKKDEK